MSNIPPNLKFTATHEWVRIENDLAVIGITDHAQSLLGDLVYIELPDEGKEVHAGDEIGVVESVKAASDYYSPLSGTVMAVNSQVNQAPDQLNHSPYDNGWLVKIKMNNADELNQLLNADEYKIEIAEEC